jgi:hypothetical protein
MIPFPEMAVRSVNYLIGPLALFVEFYTLIERKGTIISRMILSRPTDYVSEFSEAQPAIPHKFFLTEAPLSPTVFPGPSQKSVVAPRE